MAVSLDIAALRARRPDGIDLTATQGDGLGCHAGKDAMRAAAHEDINLLTVLPAAREPGLQVLGRDGLWRRLRASSSPDAQYPALRARGTLRTLRHPQRTAVHLDARDERLDHESGHHRDRLDARG